ncbi:phospholipid-binding protein [Spirochaetia bacterium]|nr:phospholipid-binding protein [Spirochaetia bacterium]
MPIITISRELAVLGDEIASELSKHLKYRFVDKATLEERIKSYGVTEQKLEKYDERKPSFFASLSQDRDEYLHYLKSAIFACAAEGNCIFIGRGAFSVLSDLPAVVPVHLTAAMDVRIARVRSYFHCDEKRAKQIISQSDTDRTGFHKYFFDVTWSDPRNYEITLNTTKLHPATCAKIIEDVVTDTITPEMEKEYFVRIKEVTLAQNIIHHVLYEKQIPIHFLEASVSNTTASLFGVASSSAVAESACIAAKEVPPVTAVHSEIQIVHEYSVMP